jgi:hypothetical protein
MCLNFQTLRMLSFCTFLTDTVQVIGGNIVEVTKLVEREHEIKRTKA